MSREAIMSVREILLSLFVIVLVTACGGRTSHGRP